MSTQHNPSVLSSTATHTRNNNTNGTQQTNNNNNNNINTCVSGGVGYRPVARTTASRIASSIVPSGSLLPYPLPNTVNQSRAGLSNPSLRLGNNNTNSTTSSNDTPHSINFTPHTQARPNVNTTGSALLPRASSPSSNASTPHVHVHTPPPGTNLLAHTRPAAVSPQPLHATLSPTAMKYAGANTTTTQSQPLFVPLARLSVSKTAGGHSSEYVKKANERVALMTGGERGEEGHGFGGREGRRGD